MSNKLQVELLNILETDVGLLEKSIHDAGGNLTLSLIQEETYSSTSKLTMAISWLRVWYIAEQIADLSESVSYSVIELDNGDAKFTFDIRITKSNAIAEKLVSWAAAFDPNDLEASAEFGAEALDWLEQRQDEVAYFPDLEEAYRLDSQEAGSDVDEI